MLINGLPSELISATDRGLMYGDGVFRTLRIRNNQAVNWKQHYTKLQQDCAGIKLKCPSIELLERELKQLLNGCVDGVAKITLTRGPATRGYTPAANPQITRILQLSPVPEYPEAYASQGIEVYVCQLRLGHQPRLAGIKHLNRLENVLAAAEWSDENIPEGLLLDLEGNIIEGTRSNLFLVRDGKLYTPDLSKCGVAGLQRERVMNYARQHKIVCKVNELMMDDVLAADEIFVVNSVIGLWPVRKLNRFTCNHFPVSYQIKEWLNNDSN